MTKAQWKAIYDYCEDNDITTKDLLRELRGAGVNVDLLKVQKKKH